MWVDDDMSVMEHEVLENPRGHYMKSVVFSLEGFM